MGPFLFAGLFGLCTCRLFRRAERLMYNLAVMTGLIGIFIPWGRTMDIFYAGGASLLFSGYVVYDTYMINKRYSPDEYIMASISLYLE